jgi:glycosyltransferase involved in cell wall biosynthesis
MSYSLGGNAVLASLAHVGLSESKLRPRAYLTETELRLERTAPTHVLFQNAWTVIPWREASLLLQEYSIRRRVREVARRRIASLNGRRAGRTLALTRYMSDLVEARGLPPTWTIAVGTSIDLFDLEPMAASVGGRVGNFALVPGSVQPYKNPLGAIRYLASMESSSALNAVVFAGPVHDLSLARSLDAAAKKIGLTPHFATYTRAEMKWLYSEAHVTIIPSRLESLNFSLGEALYFGQKVVVSPLAVHREVARSLNAQPIWIDEPESTYAPARLHHEALLPEWRGLRDILS